MLDSYRRGTLGRTDLGFFLTNYEKKYTKHNLEALITRYDHSGDGKISYDEFCQELACKA